jgi:hypothetical protein
MAICSGSGSNLLFNAFYLSDLEDALLSVALAEGNIMEVGYGKE